MRGDWPDEEEELNLSGWYVIAGLWGVWSRVEDEGRRLINWENGRVVVREMTVRGRGVFRARRPWDNDEGRIVMYV